MKNRYELRDSNNPADRGMRFSSLDRARRELAHAVPSERFVIFDREAKEIVE